MDGHLPAPLTSLVGRDSEVVLIEQQVRSGRLITLVGPPGIGKTRLALRVANSLQPIFAAGVRLAALADITDPTLVVREVAAALSIIEPSTRSIAHELGDRKFLLVLDNCEHVLESCAELATELLTACPELHIIATSRQSLGVMGETSYLVAPLPEDAAVRLFLERASAVYPAFDSSSVSEGSILRVCQRLEGIPLAIELAAVWVRTLGIDEIADHLDHRFQLLTSGNRTAPRRHQTLRAAIEWSHGLLRPNEQTFFARLGVFAGGFTLESAERVCADSDALAASDILQLLARLVDCSLVIAADRAGRVRYRMLDTLREYALERLADSGVERTIRDLHLEWCVAVAEQGERDLWRADQLSCMERLEAEHDNVRAALRWCMERGGDAEPGLRIAAAMARFWDTRGDIREALQWLEGLLALPSVRPYTPHWGRTLTALGYLTAVKGDAARSVQLLDQNLAFWRRVGDSRGLAVALFFRAMAVGWPEGDLSSVPFLEECLEYARQRGPMWTIYFALLGLGEAARVAGDLTRAEALLTESVTLSRAAGDRWGLCFALSLLCLVALAQAEPERGKALALESFKKSLEFRNTRGASVALDALACIAVSQGEVRQATRLFGAAEGLRLPIGDFAHATIRADRDMGIATVRGALGDRAFEAQYAAGRAMSVEAIVEYLRRFELATATGRAALPDHLTARELEILLLLAQRFSNSEIAERLVLSVRTVERHVTNIYNKTGVNSRREAVEYCRRHDLLSSD